MPVNVFMPAGQKAASLSVTNNGKTESSIQIRTFDWNQSGNEDQLDPSKVVVASPPLVTIAPGATQVVRLILRQSPQDREATYRILVDQIPPPAEPGVVHVVLRLSIPIFAMPSIRALPSVQFRIERDAGKLYLVGVNAGLSHEVIRDIVLTTSGGLNLKAASGASPYILAGVTRRWLVDAQGYVAQPGEAMQLTAHGYNAAIDQQVRVVAAP